MNTFDLQDAWLSKIQKLEASINATCLSEAKEKIFLSNFFLLTVLIEVIKTGLIRTLNFKW